MHASHSPTVCPHCHRRGSLIRHGTYSRYRDGGSTAAVRVQRYFCSNRFQRGGCGRSTSVLIPDLCHRSRLSTRALWGFVCAILLRDQSVLEAGRRHLPSFAESSLYRIYRRFRQRHTDLRAAIASFSPPPFVDSAQPFRQTLAHLRREFGKEDPLCALQRQTGRSLLLQR